MTLNDLLQGKGIAPPTVLVMRHRPHEPDLHKVLPWLAAERPDVFNAYQQVQNERAEKAMATAAYVASFIGHEGGKAIFVGLYRIGSTTPLTREQFWKVPANVELKKFGMRGFRDEDPRQTVFWFDLAVTEFYAEWKGKLVVGWPPPERSWWRRSHRNDIPVLAIHEESLFNEEVTPWDEMSLTWDELAVLPTRWRAKLSEWRAIYYIFDTAIGKGYVGSAYGGTNLLGRWLNYAARGHGGNVLLRNRDPKHFRFSILQRVSPDMDAADVIRLESSWKLRLQTRHPLGLNDN
jgi:hypothetical protein